MRRRYLIQDRLFFTWGLIATLLGLSLLVIFIASTAAIGWKRLLDPEFYISLPSRIPERAGLLPAIVGTVWIFVLTLVMVVPLGIAVAIYLEEFAGGGRLARWLEFFVYALASVPSVIYGILGLELFVRALGWGASLLSASAALSLLVLPTVIVAAREALRAVPQWMREASLAMGATRWQTVWNVVLPVSLPGIITGVILALSRAVGETAPLIVVGGLAFISFVPSSPTDAFTAIPLQIFSWVSRPQHGFIVNAAAAIIVLLFLTLLLNTAAIIIRARWQSKIKW